MTPNKELFIGLMSGTSIDAVDAALVAIDSQQIEVLGFIEYPIPQPLIHELHALCSSGHDEINRMGAAHIQTAQVFVEAVQALLQKASYCANDIRAIGSHGQTIRHMPQGRYAFTLQIGDPFVIATQTGIDVVADFRSKDMALGGEGAPLAPAFHQAFFGLKHPEALVLNIGGIANISYLKADGTVIGFDTGPGNTLMDAWTRECINQPFDSGGAFAAQGKVDSDLLKLLLSEPYFNQAPPKSTGRELFNPQWLHQHLLTAQHLSDADIQATLLALTVQSIANSILLLAEQGKVFVCGGGALNTKLMQQLQQLLPNFEVHTTAKVGVEPQQVEAIAFAWLAYQFTQSNFGNLPVVTGASRQAVLGALFPAK